MSFIESRKNLLEMYKKHPNEAIVADIIDAAYVAGMDDSNYKDWKFQRADMVRKIKGSSWSGRIVGFYRSTITERGYAVESQFEIGSVQIYPEAALEKIQ